jgi:hypothetical protein
MNSANPLGDREHVEEAHRLDQRLADLACVAQRRDAAHDGAEDDRRDHHLHKLDEAVAQGLERGADIGPVMAHGDSEHQADQDLDVQQLEKPRGSLHDDVSWCGQ